MDGLGATWSLYAAIAARSFRRYSTYTAATLSGVFTNCVFGVILTYTYLALWAQAPHAGGYSTEQAVTYVWLGQAALMPISIWGGSTATADLEERIRTGDVAIDLYRPVNLLGWYLAADLGRALFHLLSRGVGPIIVGALLFGIVAPSPLGLLAYVVAMVLAVVVSFGLRFMVACTAFWILDATGIRTLSTVLATFFTGLTLPLNLFPDGLRQIALALPWAACMQTPNDLWLGRRTGLSALAGLGEQALWALALLAACLVVLRAATRRVVIQGG